jgi:hypothetical protein
MENYESFVSQILRPPLLTSLKDPFDYESILVHVYRNPLSADPTETLTLENLYPFNTIYDLQTAIYHAAAELGADQQEEFHPQFQCLMQKYTIAGEARFFNFLFLFNDKTPPLNNPFTHVSNGKLNDFFVDASLNPKPVKVSPRESMLLESTLMVRSPVDSTYTLHLFLYRDVISLYKGPKPLSNESWIGLIFPYFSTYTKELELGTLDPIEAQFAPSRVSKFLSKQTLIQQLDQDVLSKPLRIPGETTLGDPLNMSSFRNIRIAWSNSFLKGKPFQIQGFFYDMKVSKDIPYIRYYPKGGASPISKISVDGPLNIPDLEDPSILLKWVDQKSITPEEHLILAKILVRPFSGNISPLYATLFIFEDGSAKFFLQPNQEAKSLGVKADLFDLPAVLDRMNASIPGHVYPPSTATLNDAYTIFSAWLSTDDKPITSKSLKLILPYFKSFFQVTSSPIKQQSPLAFLRYKSVNDFRTPARDIAFLRRVLDLQKVKGTLSGPDLIRYYKDEFDVPEETAKTRVKFFLEHESEFELVDPTVREYTQKDNPGIDIAIFGKHPYYTFHCYRVDSILTQRRIKTLLALLISAEPSDFTGEPPADDEPPQEENLPSPESPSLAPLGGVKTPQEELASEEGADKNLTDFGTDFFSDALGSFEALEENSKEPPAPLAALAAADSPVAQKVEAPKEKGKEAKGDDSDSENGSDSEPEDEDGDILDASQIKKQASRFYFGRRLDFYDKRLFKYHKIPGKTKVKGYSRMCSANELKQPVVISQEEFIRMKQIYSTDIAAGNLFFLEYPIPKSTLVKYVKGKYISIQYVNDEGENVTFTPNSNTEIITTLKYGSNLSESNIYICSEYWCRFDDIIVLKSDFLSTKDRKGKDKPKQTCPFCKQGPVIDRNNVLKGESVIQRTVKNKSAVGKRHTYVGFLKKTQHPEGLLMPCCFTKDDNFKTVGARKAIVQESHPAFASARPPTLREETTNLPALPREEVPGPIVYLSDYAKRLQDMRFSYITSSADPLELTPQGPQIGICMKAVDAFFAQDSFRDLVIQDHNVWKLMKDNITKEPNVSGFFRIAVSNSKQFRADSFLAALAPYYRYNSADDMKRVILDHIQAPLFIALNYGNFLFDYYDPAEAPSISLKELKLFAKNNLRLGLAISRAPEHESIKRIMQAFENFQISLSETSTPKHFRQFAQFLSLPNLLYPFMNGILFIVLELTSSGVSVRCPPYGVSKEMMQRCDIAFILYHKELKAWEPLFYSYNNPKEEEFGTTLVFTRDEYDSWPDIVKQRTQEYFEKCASSGLGLYTDSPRIHPSTLIPLSTAMNIFSSRKGTKIYALLRDSYNHVAAILLEENYKMVSVPVIDDGSVYPDTPVELDWKKFFDPSIVSFAPAEDAMAIYKFIQSLPSLSDTIKASYEGVSIIRLDKTLPDKSLAYALQLANGLFVPILKPKSPMEEVSESKLAVSDAQELPWAINSKLVYGKTKSISMDVDYKDFEEIYQHLRLTFSNWLATASPDFKQDLNDVLFKYGKPNPDMPLFEKRERLFIRFGPVIQSWLDSSLPAKGRKQSIKRVDCRIQGPDSCSNACVWKADPGACLLHVPKWDQKNVPQMLVRKLIDELIRFPTKREEILKKQVNPYQVLRDAIRTENEFLVPENSPAWTDFLRMKWKEEDSDTPKYAEEFIALGPSSSPSSSTNLSSPDETPDVISSYFGDGFTFIPFEENDLSLTLLSLDVDVSILLDEGLSADAPVIPSLALAQSISKLLHLSIFQLTYEDGSFVPNKPLIVNATIKPPKPLPYFIIVKKPDGVIGYLSSTPEEFTPVSISDLPRNVKILISKVGTIKIPS